MTAYAAGTAGVTLLLIALGGSVTSRGAGLAVPDWPNSYGYNMFLFPPSMWVGGILYEHTHRLLASFVGLLTVGLAVWLAVVEKRRWLRWLGLAALVLVVVQGILGGLRVVWLKDEIGVFHATLAQLFFALICAITLATTRWWRESDAGRGRIAGGRGLRWLILGATALILGQLVLGATMRHRHAGLAIPDFPLAHGRLWPATDRESVARYNRDRPEVRAVNPVTAADMNLQMAHRILALGILAAVGFVARTARRELGSGHGLSRAATIWFLMIIGQAFLGAATIWSNKAADVATAHVAVGSLALALGALMAMSCWAPRSSDRSYSRADDRSSWCEA